MEEQIQIKSLRWYPQATAQQLVQWTEELQTQDSGTLIVLPHPTEPDQYIGVLQAKYYTGVLSTCTGVCEVQQADPFVFLVIHGRSIRGFFTSVMRKIQFCCPGIPFCSTNENVQSDLNQLLSSQEDPPPCGDTPSPIHRFLQNHTPAHIQRQLEEYVIGQPELTRAVADFLYYHALRQIHPALPQRPLMISGPSGSGKTEVWRIVQKLYGDQFPIRIIDGSNLSCEGWSGNYKLDTYIDTALADGGILVVDEFDKLTKPKFTSGGNNVSLDIQSEFLKLIEGEYRLTQSRKQSNMTTEKMGVVLVGAFESLRAQKQGTGTQSKSIGFCSNSAPQAAEPLTDEDFITYGILPEIVGRIAVKCEAKTLSDCAYIEIIRSPHSRVSQLAQVLHSYGVGVSDFVSTPALLELIAESKDNHTGVRWVSAQVESRLLEAIHDQGVFQMPAAAS